MREIRTRNWSESFTLVPRNQIKCRALSESPDLAVFSTSPCSPPAQTPGRCPSVLVTGWEGCTAGGMCLCSQRAGLIPGDFHRNENHSNPQGTLWAEGKCLLFKLPQLCQAVLHPKGTEGLLPAFQIPEKKEQITSTLPFLHKWLISILPPTLVLLLLKVESLSCIWFNNNSRRKKNSHQ